MRRERRGTRIPKAEVWKVLPCLKCREPFESEGPGERICGKCKLGADWRTGLALPEGDRMTIERSGSTRRWRSAL